jgi:hypothetical protein
VATDGGTYQYNTFPPWDTAFSSSAAHNTATVDGQEQMRRFSRFLWLNWAKGRELRHTKSGGSEVWAGEHDGYRRLGVTHRREVERRGDSWTIRDEVLGGGEHRVRLQWLLSDWSCEADIETGMVRLNTSEGTVQIHTSAGSPARFSLVHSGQYIAGNEVGKDISTRGWVSQTYAAKTAALSFVVEASGKLPIRFETRVEFEIAQKEIRDIEAPIAEVKVCANDQLGPSPSPDLSTLL